MSTIAPIADLGELDEILARSRRRPVWVFKHSLTCGVSSRARRAYEAFVAGRAADGDPGAEFLLLEVQRARPLSHGLAAATGVIHQSPQVLLLRGGRAVWSSSHFRITEAALAEAAAEHGG